MTAAAARALAIHEARVHAAARRELRVLGHGMLLYDPLDAEPFWNRLVAPDFPSRPAEFDRLLAETYLLFGTLTRYPHIRPLAEGNRPTDIAARLGAVGFELAGEDRTMVLRDPAACHATAAAVPTSDVPTSDVPTSDVTIERVARSTADIDARAREIAATLAAAFAVDAIREAAIERDARATIGRRGVEFVIVRVDGVVATVAKRTSLRGMAYLSSIGTRPAMRGKGYARLATAVAVTTAMSEGARLVHLVVESDNRAAIAMYASLGFDVIGAPVPDLVLRP